MVEHINSFYQSLGVAGGHAEAAQACPQAQIHNLVGTAKIMGGAGPLDLFVISNILPNSTYDKQKFVAIAIRISEPQCTVLLFTSGKMVLTGCRTFLECISASHEVVRLLERGVLGSRFRLNECMIQNIVGNVDLKLASNQSMDLDRLHSTHSVVAASSHSGSSRRSLKLAPSRVACSPSTAPRKSAVVAQKRWKLSLPGP